MPAHDRHRRRSQRFSALFRARPWLEILEDRTLLSAPAYLPPSYMLSNPEGLLSNPTPGSVVNLSLDFLRDHAGSFQLQPADLIDAEITDSYTDVDTGISHVYLRQRVNGLEVEFADLSVHVNARGQVIAASGG